MAGVALGSALTLEGGGGGADESAGTLPGPAAGPIEAVVHADALAHCLRLLTRLAPGAAGWSVEDRRRLLERLDHAIDGLAAVRAAVLVAEREAGTWRGGGDRSFEAWRGRTSRAGDRAASAQVRQADALAAVPAAAAAVTAGRIGLEHAAVIGKLAATGTPTQQQAVRSVAGQADLLALATVQDAGTFATTAARWAASLDPDALEADHQAQYRQRFVHLTDTPRGTYLKARLDTMAGHRLRLALEALTPRPAADDDRDAGQRCADALDTMAGRILSDPDTKPGGHVPPHVSLILTEQTWVAARAHRDRQRATRKVVQGDANRARDVAPHRNSPSGAVEDAATTTPGSDPDHDLATAQVAPVGYEPATLEDGTPVPASELAQVLCDCAVTRIAIDASGVPLDLGRTQRLFSGEQRRAIIARDRQCIWPGCHLPARWCQIHHRIWWERDNGTTRVEDGVLLCTHHHHETHRLDLAIIRILDQPPPGRRRPPSTLALVGYELRDPTGRLVGAGGPPGGAVHPPPDLAASCDPAPPRGAPTTPPPARSEPQYTQPGTAPGQHQHACLPDGTGAPASDSPPASARTAANADELELEWVDDPFTGARVPAFFLAG